MTATHPSIPVVLALALMPIAATAHEIHTCAAGFPDAPVLSGHVHQTDINSGALSFKQITDAGEALFVARFNTCDGQGRPSATGTGDKRVADEPAFIRTSAPESNSCAGCHAQPRAGGAGDIVTSVFVLAQAADPVNFSVAPEFSNERNTLGMNGSGAIEMLSREMTVDLQTQAGALPDGAHTLTTKGINFEITKLGGVVTASRGVDTDLVVKPFHQAGVVISLREFTANAMNHHHGMQAEERFDMNPAKGFDPDFDEDGVARELTVGDITANTLWQAQLGVPGRAMPKSQEERERVQRGEEVFDDVGCTSCHVPKLELQSRFFVEPNPFNPPGTCSDITVCPEYRFDMTKQGEGPLLEKGKKGGAIVRAYTDLKRHNLCDEVTDPDPVRHFCNEHLAQGRPDQDGKPGTEFFLTRKLWDVGNSAPYGHRGDLTTIAEAILAHGGEARSARDLFLASAAQDQIAVVKFLKTLQVVAPDDED